MRYKGIVLYTSFAYYLITLLRGSAIYLVSGIRALGTLRVLVITSLDCLSSKVL